MHSQWAVCSICSCEILALLYIVKLVCFNFPVYVCVHVFWLVLNYFQESTLSVVYSCTTHIITTVVKKKGYFLTWFSRRWLFTKMGEKCTRVCVGTRLDIFWLSMKAVVWCSRLCQTYRILYTCQLASFQNTPFISIIILWHPYPMETIFNHYISTYADSDGQMDSLLTIILCIYSHWLQSSVTYSK